jgi:hypothetical protein
MATLCEQQLKGVSFGSNGAFCAIANPKTPVPTVYVNSSPSRCFSAIAVAGVALLLVSHVFAN